MNNRLSRISPRRALQTRSSFPYPLDGLDLVSVDDDDFRHQSSSEREPHPVRFLSSGSEKPRDLGKMGFYGVMDIRADVVMEGVVILVRIA